MRHLGAGLGAPLTPVLASGNYSGQVNAKEDTGVQYGLANTGRKLLQPAQRGTGRQLPLEGQRAWASRRLSIFPSSVPVLAILSSYPLHWQVQDLSHAYPPGCFLPSPLLCPFHLR